MKVNITKNEFQTRKDDPNRVFHSYEGNIGDYTFTAETDSNGTDGINKGSIYKLDIYNENSSVGRYDRKWEYRSKNTKDGAIRSTIIKYIDSISDKKDGEPIYKEKNETMNKMNKFAEGSTEMLKVELANNLREQQGMNKMMLENDMPKTYVGSAMKLQARAEDLVKELKHRGVNIDSILYKDYDRFAVGGEVGNQVSFKGDYGTPRSGIVKEKRGSSYIVATDNGDRLVDSYEVISFSDAPIEKKKRFGFFEDGGSVWTKEQKEKVKAIDDSFEKFISKRGIERNSKAANDFWIEGGFKRRMGEIFEDKFEGGGEIQSKIDKLQSVVNSKMLPEGVKDKARKQIAELEKELHEGRKDKGEWTTESLESELNYYKNLLRNIDKPLYKDYNKKKVEEIISELEDKLHESKETKAEEKEEDKKGGSEAKKPTTRKATTRKAPAKKTEVKKDLPKIKAGDTIKVYATNGDLIIDEVFKNDKGEVSYRGKYIANDNLKSYHSSKKTYEYILNEQDTIVKPKADHKKLVAKLKAKKGATPSNEPSKGHKRSESSDRKREALPLGKRVSADGSVYYENRLNRADMNKEDKFKEGGEVKSSGWGLKFLKW
jgi:hypothetical protein